MRKRVDGRLGCSLCARALLPCCQLWVVAFTEALPNVLLIYYLFVFILFNLRLLHYYFLGYRYFKFILLVYWFCVKYVIASGNWIWMSWWMKIFYRAWENLNKVVFVNFWIITVITSKSIIFHSEIPINAIVCESKDKGRTKNREIMKNFII